MGRLADRATALDIIAQLHASLLLCSFIRMAAGELNKRAAVWTLLVCICVFFRGCVCACGHSVCGGCFCSSLPALAASVLAWTLACVCVCARAHAQRTRMWRWRVCVHACRMTFSKMWQREKKHLTHNWSAMKEIWSWICIRLTCSALNERQEHAPTSTTLPPWRLITMHKMLLHENDRGKRVTFKVSDPDDKIVRL